MTQAADIIRDKRRHWAAPGGSHDRTVQLLARWLPGAIGVVAAMMILGPLVPRGEISFLLDRNKVAVTPDRLRVADALYRGEDKQGRPFTVTAGSAVQHSPSEPVVEMHDLIARILLSDGVAQLSATNGAYDYSREDIKTTGPVEFSAADGYRLTTSSVSIDLKNRRVNGDGGVTGTVPTGSFSANRISADLTARTVVLEGNARLRMVPGQLKVPQ